MNENDKCVLCRGLNGPENECEEYNTPLMETENFVVLADRLPVAKYHFIVVSKQHYINIIDILKAGLARELKEISAYIENRLVSRGAGTALLFEHGKYHTGLSGSSKSVDHFHLHIAAEAPGIVSELRTRFTHAKCVHCFDELATPEVIADDYLLVSEAGQDEIWIFTHGMNIPSQYIRRLLYQKMDEALLEHMKMGGDNGFDWKTGKSVITPEMLREYKQILIGDGVT